MFKKLLAIIALLLCAAVSSAANADTSTASTTDLGAPKGIGPVISGRASKNAAPNASGQGICYPTQPQKQEKASRSQCRPVAVTI